MAIGSEANLDAGASGRSQHELIHRFAGSNGDYYTDQIIKIQSSRGLTLSFNWAAAVFGPLWTGYRGLWGIFFCVAILELLALVPLAQGLVSDLGADHRVKLERLEKNQERMLGLVEKAIEAGDKEKAASLKKNADNLSRAAQKSSDAAKAADDLALTLVAGGIIALLTLKALEGCFANYIYEKQYVRWRADRRVTSGVSRIGALAAAILVIVIYGLTLYRFTAPSPAEFLSEFPVSDNVFHDPVADWIAIGFDRATVYFSGFFLGISGAIRVTLDGLETVFVATPWPVVMTVIIVTAWRLAGVRVAIITVAAIAYIAVLGFWERSMSTVALLGTAAVICTVIGIPLGIWFSRSERAYQIGRPILDFMQTMPAFVYLIPIIALFGTGKPPGILVAIIFGLPPIVRLTNLGLRGVPEDVKEAATAFGANRLQILTGVEMPLAMNSIMAGINQTILFCLSAIVIASLIGAKGLGYDVLIALQYAAKGQGVLAGLAILFCAMVIDRIVQGLNTR